MIFYCPNCWSELGSERQFCARCGQNISSPDEKTFTDKLLQALSHPEPTTVMRAVYILGEKGSRHAVEPLLALFKQSRDPFLQREILIALGKIGVVSAVIEALRHPSFIVRAEAANVLAKFHGEEIVSALREQALKDASEYVRETAKAALAVFEKSEG